MTSISSITTLSTFKHGDTKIDFRLDKLTGSIGLRLYPSNLSNRVVPRREWLNDFEQSQMKEEARQVRASPVDSLVQVKCVGDDYPTGFSQGASLRNSATTLGLKYVKQDVESDGFGTRVRTFLRDGRGLTAEHRLVLKEGQSAISVETVLSNDSLQDIKIELLSSFSIGDLTPFDEGDAPNRLRIHRFRSAWSAEGRLETRTLEELNLERSWQDHAVRVERFGQVGSLPVKGFFPFAAVEDIEAGVCWGAQVAWLGSWQMEYYRQGDALCLSGGLADREFGHWMKVLKPGARFTTPTAILACVDGDLDALCHRLTQSQKIAADQHPVGESELPIICNEFCTSWGNPNHENLEILARSLKGKPVRYLVIDAGWYGKPGSAWWAQQGDWKACPERFPDGLVETARMIRSHGLVPGLWFEMEVAGAGADTYSRHDHQLSRDGVPITTTKRRFWDFRDPWVHQHLAESIIKLLRDGNFGYVKFDYNETIGIGVDGAESLGEGLRQHLSGVVRFIDRIRRELPELVIESCSSGGHRLEPLMVGRSAMSSFSDAHESREIPIIAANIHRVMLPRQSQIWAVLRREDNPSRLIYSLASTFLGRMCLSGDLARLQDWQWAQLEVAMRFYREVAPIIKAGRSYRYGPLIPSYRHPEGWQAVLRVNDARDEILVVAHAFKGVSRESIVIPLPSEHCWRVHQQWSTSTARIHKSTSKLYVCLTQDFEAVVIHLKKEDNDEETSRGHCRTPDEVETK